MALVVASERVNVRPNGCIAWSTLLRPMAASTANVQHNKLRSSASNIKNCSLSLYNPFSIVVPRVILLVLYSISRLFVRTGH